MYCGVGALGAARSTAAVQGALLRPSIARPTSLWVDIGHARLTPGAAMLGVPQVVSYRGRPRFGGGDRAPQAEEVPMCRCLNILANDWCVPELLQGQPPKMRWTAP